MKNILSLILISAILFSSETVFSQNEQVTLRIKSEVGEVQDLKFSTKISTSGIEVDMDMYLNTVTKATNIDNSLFDFETEFRRVVMSMNGMGMDLTYDSDKELDDSDPILSSMADGLEPLIGAKIITQISDLGEVLNIDYGDKKNIFEQQTFDFKGSQVPLPEEVITVGSEWSEEKEMNGMNTSFAYKVTDITDEAVMIELTGNIISEEINESTISGSYIVNRATGFTSKLDMLIKMTAGGQAVDMEMNLEAVE